VRRVVVPVLYSIVYPTPGFLRLVFTGFQAGEEAYDPQYHTEEKAMADADEIYKKGQGKFFGTDERVIFKILCASPPEHILAINKAYAEKRGYTLTKAMEKELRGDVEDAAVHLIGMKTKPYAAAAAMIKEACRGIGTDELVRIYLFPLLSYRPGTCANHSIQNNSC